VADLLELSSCSPIWYWEKGLKYPSVENALKLSALLQCPVEILFLEKFNEIRHELFERKNESDNPLLH
jgi:transcriptional regulator with XRE-family HTH domain